MVYDLFEFVRLLNVGGEPSESERTQVNQPPKGAAAFPGAETRHTREQRIHCFAWSDSPRCHYLALGLTNWSLLLYRLSCAPDNRPLLKHLPWYHHPSKQVAVMCFDPTGSWLLVAAKDATLFILPALLFVDPLAKLESEHWSTEDTTEIKLPGRRAMPTAICWWQTSDGQPVAIVGNELGEISFFNLQLKSEVGGTYITVSIASMEIIEDEINTCSYLLISGTNAVQWQLILENQSNDYRWPLDKSNSTTKKKETFKSISDDRPSGSAAAVASDKDTRPKRLVQFAGHTQLRSQRFRGRVYISGHCQMKSVLSIHCADLHVSPISVYKVPAHCRTVVLADRLMFVVTAEPDVGSRVRIVCTELAGATLDGRRVLERGVETGVGDDGHDVWEMQGFAPVPADAVVGLLARQSPVGGEGCILVTRHNIYALRPRISPDDLFLDIVLNESNHSKAEHLVHILGLDSNFLYEKAAERRLSQSLVVDAVRLYEMGKCPHVRSVANFAAFGHLSQLLSYVRLLFAKRSSDFSLGDLKHFSNVALYCFVEETLEQGSSDTVLRKNFRDFLLDNQHYDELLAVHLLSAYGIHDLMAEVAARRGLIPHMLSEILPTREEMTSWRGEADAVLRPKWADADACQVFRRRGYTALVSLLENESFIECLFHEHLPMYIGLRPDLMQRHLALAKFLIPLWKDNYSYLKALLCIYNPTSPFMVPILCESRRKRDCSYSSMVTNNDSCDFLDVLKMEDHNLSHEMSKLFLGLLILLTKVDNPTSKFDASLIVPKMGLHKSTSHSESSFDSTPRLRLPRRGVRISCGYAHTGAVINGEMYTWGRSLHGCLGRGSARREWAHAEPIPLLRSPAVCVLSVACGAAHTVAMTDVGVYSWGLNCYGQLGIGGTDAGLTRKRCHPMLVNGLAHVDVVSVACGQYHSLALAADGAVYSWGWGVYGQLGQGRPHNVGTPRLVELCGDRRLVSRIAGGYAHSLLLTTEGEVLVSGCGTFGQLGSGKTMKENSPIRVDLPEAVTLATAGYFHNVAVGTSGKVYMWGCHPQTLRLRAQVSRRMRGARVAIAESSSPMDEALTPLYDPSRAPGVFTPTVLEMAAPLTSEIVHVACGSNHSLFLTADGDVFTWGRNLDGQLGHESRKERSMPTQIGFLNDRRIVQGACGADFTVLLDDTGKVWGLGIDDCGQITGAVDRSGHKDTNTTPSSTGKILTVRTNKRVVQIKSPTRHGVYKPITLNGLPQMNTPVTSKMMSQELHDTKVQPFLSPLDISTDSSLTNAIVHSALEQLYELYDVTSVAELCESSGNLQGAAKVFLIDGQYQRSFLLNLTAITADESASSETRAELALNLLGSYLRFIQDDVKVLQNVLKSIILFWSLHTLETEMLEEFFQLHISKFLCPLAFILFSGSESDEGDSGQLNYVTSRLSTGFCLSLVNEILEKVKTGRPQPEMVDMLSNVVNLERLELSACDVWGSHQLSSGLVIPAEQVSTDHLWTELTQNLYKDMNARACIDLSASDVEHLLRDADVVDPDTDPSAPRVAAVFTCGHHHAWDTFRSAVLQRFRDCLAESAPQTTRNLMNVYATEGFLPMACPKCLVKGAQEEKA